MNPYSSKNVAQQHCGCAGKGGRTETYEIRETNRTFACSFCALPAETVPDASQLLHSACSLSLCRECPEISDGISLVNRRDDAVLTHLEVRRPLAVVGCLSFALVIAAL
jgi:hypothetical protein